MVSFTKIVPQHTNRPKRFEIEGIGPSVVVNDIPSRFIGIESNENLLAQHQWNEEILQMKGKVQQLKMQNSDIQKKLVAKISELFALFQK